MSNNQQTITGDNNIQIGSVGSVTIVVKDKDNILNFPGVTVRPENTRKLFKQSLVEFIEQKIKELNRSEEWLKVMAYRELGIVYQDFRKLEKARLIELCDYVDSFYMERNDD